MVLALGACSGETTAPAVDPAASPETAAAPSGSAAAEAAAAPAMSADAMAGPIAGKWRMTISASGVSLPPQDKCFDHQISFAEAQGQQQAAGMTCSEHAITPTADGLMDHSICTKDGVTVTTDTKMTGDFNSAYTLESSTTMTGAPAPAMTIIKMERLGDCDAKTP
jgi:hypothetical protein